MRNTSTFGVVKKPEEQLLFSLKMSTHLVCLKKTGKSLKISKKFLNRVHLDQKWPPKTSFEHAFLCGPGCVRGFLLCTLCPNSVSPGLAPRRTLAEPSRGRGLRYMCAYGAAHLEPIALIQVARSVGNPPTNFKVQCGYFVTTN